GASALENADSGGEQPTLPTIIGASCHISPSDDGYSQRLLSRNERLQVASKLLAQTEQRTTRCKRGFKQMDKIATL
ncbi:hypothetical protein HaLaN_32358, partial [Haematococcus lacustris]